MKKTLPIIKKLGAGLIWAIWTGGVLFLVQLGLSFLLSWLFSVLPINITSAAAQAFFSILSYLLSIFIIIKVPEKLSPKLAQKLSPKLAQKLSPKLKTTKSSLGLNELPTWTDIGLAAAGFIAYILLASLFTAIFSVFPWFDANQAQDVGFNTLFLTSDRIFAFLTIVIVAPIAEELIFRGFLYQKIKSIFFHETHTKPEKPVRKSTKKAELLAIIIATLITSLTFGVMHGQWNVGVNVFAMSIVLCLMREITGSIYSGILLHMIKNMIAFYLLYIATIGF